MIKTPLLSAALVGLVALSPSLLRAAEPGQPSISVSYADLDLGHAAGRSVLQQRLARAADQLCGDSHDHRDLRQTQALRACRARALDQAAPQMTAAIDAAQKAQLAVAAGGKNG